jgi:pimeloyl-ACP methyl ester carboxylesterase
MRTRDDTPMTGSSPGAAGHGPVRSSDLHISHISVDETTIRVATSGHGPPLVLLNGFGANIEMWAPFPPLLTGRRIVMFDAPGTGESPPLRGPRRMPAFAHLLGRMLDVQGIDQADILGYSWGGALAQQFAHQAAKRVRSLVLVSTIYGLGGLPPSMWALGNMLTPKRYYSYGYLEKVAPRLYGGVTRRNLAGVRMQAQARIDRPPSANGYAKQLYAIAGWTSAPWLWTLRPRTLVIVGDDDPLVRLCNAKIMAHAIPRAQLQVIKGGGHLLLNDQAPDAAAVVDRFLLGQSSAR